MAKHYDMANREGAYIYSTFLSAEKVHVKFQCI